EENIKDKSQSECSYEAITTITINKIKELINNDLHITICQLVYEIEQVIVSKQLLKILEKGFANIITKDEM
ncbi:34427_t:CDS:2, partial [Racocetra persica]